MNWRPKLSRRRIALTPDEMKPKMICSVYPENIYRSHWAGGIMIPGRKGNKPYGYVLVGPGSERDDKGGWIEETVCLSSNLMAHDYIGLFPEGVPNPDSMDPDAKYPTISKSELSGMGIFVPKEDFPTEEELAIANDKLYAWASDKVAEADAKFSATKRTDHVDRQTRVAVAILKLEREWAASRKRARVKISCPACVEDVNENAKKCPSCDALIGYDEAGKPYWLDAPKAVKMGAKE